MFITNLIRVFGEWRRYRELAALGDRGLKDIGLNRSMIRRSMKACRWNYVPPISLSRPA
jgi:uncharacterized protein YjiS (DUF1127 family)